MDPKEQEDFDGTNDIHSYKYMGFGFITTLEYLDDNEYEQSEKE